MPVRSNAAPSGEIRHLASILNPKVGIVTGISPCHLEGFGTISDIYEAKLELADALAINKADGDNVERARIALGDGADDARQLHR